MTGAVRNWQRAQSGAWMRAHALVVWDSMCALACAPAASSCASANAAAPGSTSCRTAMMSQQA
ncbi:MAG: hypothetical protein DMD36_15060 [Gemmatimonadetes bacterium]|nr:MAG: hypothetical protein DMD36_15060 [Gemmatimonadota bacterium]